MFKRVVLKLSGEYLAGELDETRDVKSAVHYDEQTVDRIVGEITALHAEGVEIAVVTGGGNFWRGAEAPKTMDRVRADHMGMLASVMNGVFLEDRFKNKLVDARVMTPFTVGATAELYDRDAADKKLKNGSILIFSGGSGHPFFSTDTITAIRAAELGACCAMFAKGVEGVCDTNPKFLQAGESYGVYREITCEKIIRDNLFVIDMSAAQILMQQKVYSVLFDIRQSGNIAAACRDNNEIYDIGTKIYYDKNAEWEERICLSKQPLTKKK